MIKYIKKIIKKQKLLKKYKKGPKQYLNHSYLLRNWDWSIGDGRFFNHQFLCELRCYNRIKKL